MTRQSKALLAKVFPICRSIVGPKAWLRLLAACDGVSKPESLPKRLAAMKNRSVIPDYLPELARLEWTQFAVSQTAQPAANKTGQFDVNPTLELLRLSWLLCGLVSPAEGTPPAAPRQGVEHAMVWRDPKTGQTRVQAADDADLLALKIVIEAIPLAEAAAEAEVSLPVVENALWHGSEKGILLAPQSLIRRDPALFPISDGTPETLLASETFMIQWHITQACDLRCKHCYDRSKRSPLTLTQGSKVLDDLRKFCLDHRVQGHVCFTGGNPFLHPHFNGLYRAASDRGFSLSILGNPVERAAIENLMAIQPLRYYQVSLEGLPKHNDAIRGAGHFARTIGFLGVLRSLGIRSAVMLTLTRDNMNQILPLGERLRGHADSFTFNRLSQVGEGAKLVLPSRKRYATFLEEYVRAAENNPMLAFKDNLINIALQRRDQTPFDGCTGHGCGAAFNFVALLPDGEVHACRKFPSPVGNILTHSLSDIYDSPVARQYRAGCHACSACPLRPACGGCMAIAFGHGLNPFESRDPYCLMEQTPSARPELQSA